MTVYRYDLDELEQTRSGLSQLAADFESASSVRDSAEGAMGYDSLREAIQEFTDNWKHNREKQLEAINGSASMLGDICTNYRDFDSGAVNTLLEGA